MLLCPSLYVSYKNIRWVLFIPCDMLVRGIMVSHWLFVFHLSVHLYVCLYLCFQMITLVNINGFSTNLVYTLILWSSSFWLLMGKFCQFLTELSAHDASMFSFTDDNLSKYQCIFTKLGICIDVVEIWFGIANGQISSTLTVVSQRHIYIFISGWSLE